MNYKLPRRNPIAAAVAASLAVSVPLATMAQEEGALEEVIVTATRRAQTVQEIPYNITAISGDQIAAAGATDLASLLRTVPGVVFADMGARANSQNSSIVLRGLSVNKQVDGGAFANLAVPTVSSYMDDTPLFLNLRLTDIERVEVLRGPQGTLYGSGSLAGTVRYIHNRPDTENTAFSIGASVESMSESDEQSYDFSAMANVPVSVNAAFRVAATYADIGGLFDATDVFERDSAGIPVLQDPADVVGSPAAVVPTAADVDESEAYSIRGSLLVDASDNVELVFVAHQQHQESTGDGFREGFQSDYTYPAASINTFEEDATLLSLEVQADLGFATLTSSTSSTKTEIETSRDLSPIIPILDSAYACLIYGCYPRGLFIGNEPAERKDFTQELRLVSSGDGAVDWLVGAYYSDQEADLVLAQTVFGYADWANTPGSDVFFADAYLGYPGGFGLTWADMIFGYVANPADEDYQFFNDRTVDFEDLALYGEVTYHATDDWQLTFGARFFEQEYKSSLLSEFTNCGIFCSEDGTDVRGVSSATSKEDTSDEIFKFNTSYALNDDTNIYFTWAEGFRHGGANALPVGAFGITDDLIPYEADKTTNYEAGIKGSFGDGRYDYTVAAYFIDWDDPQLDVFVSLAFLPAVVNGTAAESTGLEIELRGQPTDNLSFALGYNYTDAELTKDFVAGSVTGVKGSPLPGVAESMANVAMDYVYPLKSGNEVVWHLDGQYKGEAENALLGDVAERELPAFSLWNTSIGWRSDSWAVTVFVRNLFDEQDAVYAYTDFFNWEAAARPRSYGLRISYDY